MHHKNKYKHHITTYYHTFAFLLLFLMLYLSGCSKIKPGSSPTPSPSVAGSTPEPVASRGKPTGPAKDRQTFQYRGGLGNAGRFPYNGPIRPSVLWKFKANGKIRGSASVTGDGRIVFGTQKDALYILDEAGKLIKKVNLNSWVFSSPAIDNKGGIYVGCDNGEVLRLDRDGKKLWTHRLKAETSSSPALYGGMVFIGAEDNALYALTLDGMQAWRLKTGGRILFSSPAVDDAGNVYIGAEDGILYQVTPDGSPGWKFDTGTEISTTSPVIGDNGNIFIASGKNIFCLDLSGKLVWKKEAHEEVMANIAVSKGRNPRIYAAAIDGVFLILDHKGKLTKKMKISPQVFAGPVIDKEGRVYVTGVNNLVIIDDRGEMLYNEVIPDAGPFKGAPIITQKGRIVAGGMDGVVYCFGD